MNELTNTRLRVGTVNGAHGIKGWNKVFSYTDPKEQIISYQPWLVGSNAALQPLEVVEWRWQGERLVVRFKDVLSRNQAEMLVGREVWIEQSQLEPLAEEEYYWHQLIGLSVIDEAGHALGSVKSMLETGANDVMVVGFERDAVHQERLIPYVWDHVVKGVDLHLQRITVAWSEDYDR